MTLRKIIMKVVRFCLMVAMGLMLQSCAITYVDKEGATHVLGFAAIRIPPALNRDCDTAIATKITSWGFSLTRTEAFSGMSIGYNSDEFLALPPASCVLAFKQRGSFFPADTDTTTK